jgi:hypothetical protein
VIIDLSQPQKDLIALVADKNMEAALRSILQRHESLEIRQINFDILVHPHRDPGCLLNAHTFLQPFNQRYMFSVVMFDKEGCGHETKTTTELQSYVENSLFERGWTERSCAITIDPELEAWIWKNSPHVSNALDWDSGIDNLYLWLKQKGYLEENENRPKHPKEALEAALRNVKKPRSSSIYAELGSKLGLKRCTDPSFLRLKSYLQVWFPSPQTNM